MPGVIAPANALSIDENARNGHGASEGLEISLNVRCVGLVVYLPHVIILATDLVTVQCLFRFSAVRTIGLGEDHHPVGGDQVVHHFAHIARHSRAQSYTLVAYFEKKDITNSETNVEMQRKDETSLNSKTQSNESTKMSCNYFY